MMHGKSINFMMKDELEILMSGNSINMINHR